MDSLSLDSFPVIITVSYVHVMPFPPLQQTSIRYNLDRCSILHNKVQSSPWNCHTYNYSYNTPYFPLPPLH